MPQPIGGCPEKNCRRDRRGDRLEAAHAHLLLRHRRRLHRPALRRQSAGRVPRRRGLSDADMQALAAEFNLSETTFVAAAGRSGQHRPRAHLQPPQRDAVRRPSQCRHRLGAGPAGPRQRRRAALRGDRRPGRDRGRRSRRRHHRRAAAAVARRRKCRSSCWPAASASRRATSSTAAHRPVGASVGNSFVIAEVTRRGPDPRRARYRPLPGGGEDLHGDGAEPPAALSLCP